MRTTYPNQNLQRGAAALILVLLVLLTGTAVMFSGISAQEFKTERDKQTSRALAEAKQAIIAWSVRNATPGQLPCPEDKTKIGSTVEGEAMTICNTLPAIGRLPWKTLGLGDLRDGNGDQLWYVISNGFRGSPINSDTVAQLTVDGVANNAVAIVFSPGIPLDIQSRLQPTSSSPPNPADYLDLANADGDNSFISKLANTTFNDRLIQITHDDLFSAVEKKVLREVRRCFDDYAAASGGKYSWAVPMADYNSAIKLTTAKEGTLFGRVPTNLSRAVSAVDDTTMKQYWSQVASCSLLFDLTSYWYSNNWQDFVFYQISTLFKPGTSTASDMCTVNHDANCLNVNGSGSYHAILLIAGNLRTGESRATDTQKKLIQNYLEEDNAHTTSSPALNFEAYRFKEAGYTQVNDQIACLDGSVNCR